MFCLSIRQDEIKKKLRRKEVVRGEMNVKAIKNILKNQNTNV